MLPEEILVTNVQLNKPWAKGANQQLYLYNLAVIKQTIRAFKSYNLCLDRIMEVKDMSP